MRACRKCGTSLQGLVSDGGAGSRVHRLAVSTDDADEDVDNGLKSEPVSMGGGTGIPTVQMVRKRVRGHSNLVQVFAAGEAEGAVLSDGENNDDEDWKEKITERFDGMCSDGSDVDADADADADEVGVADTTARRKKGVSQEARDRRKEMCDVAAEYLIALTRLYLCARGMYALRTMSLVADQQYQVFQKRLDEYWAAGHTAFRPPVNFTDVVVDGVRYEPTAPQIHQEEILQAFRAVILCARILSRDPDALPKTGRSEGKAAMSARHSVGSIRANVNIDAMVAAIVARAIGGDSAMTKELVLDVRIMLMDVLKIDVIRAASSKHLEGKRAPIIAVLGVTLQVRPGMGNARAQVPHNLPGVEDEDFHAHGLDVNGIRILGLKARVLFDALSAVSICKPFTEGFMGVERVGVRGRNLPIVCRVPLRRVTFYDSVKASGFLIVKGAYGAEHRVIVERPLFLPTHAVPYAEDCPAELMELLAAHSEQSVAAAFTYETLTDRFPAMIDLLGVVDKRCGHVFALSPMAVATGCVVEASGTPSSRSIFSSHYIYLLYRITLMFSMAPQVARETFGAGVLCIVAWMTLPNVAYVGAPVSVAQLPRARPEDATDAAERFERAAEMGDSCEEVVMDRVPHATVPVEDLSELAEDGSGGGAGGGGGGGEASALAGVKEWMYQRVALNLKNSKDGLGEVFPTIFMTYNCKSRGVMDFVYRSLREIVRPDAPHATFVRQHFPMFFPGMTQLLLNSVGSPRGATEYSHWHAARVTKPRVSVVTTAGSRIAYV